jgi:hypothetical protein
MSCMNRMPRMSVMLTNEQREEVGLYLEDLKFPGCGQFKIPPCSKRVVSENLH